MIPQGPSTDLTEEAGTIAGVWNVFLPMAIGVFLLVVLLVIYVVVRFRRRDTLLAKQTHYRPAIEITYVVIPLIVVIGLFLLTLTSLHEIESHDSPPDLVVDVIGFQWDWRFDYPDLGVSVTGDRSDVPPELVLPAGAKVRFNISSVDVIHSFWIPEFHFKRDAIPGSPTSFAVRMTEQTGTFDSGVCAEFCGLYHTDMRFTVRVVDRGTFDDWVAEQRSEPS